ncbi:MAG: hypothetical protein R2695_20990 [Acidimicrobiales bacterium]
MPGTGDGAQPVVDRDADVADPGEAMEERLALLSLVTRHPRAAVDLDDDRRAGRTGIGTVDVEPVAWVVAVGDVRRSRCPAAMVERAAEQPGSVECRSRSRRSGSRRVVKSGPSPSANAAMAVGRARRAIR